MSNWKTFLKHYEVSDNGYVRNSKTNKILKTFIDKQGYEKIRFKHLNYSSHIHRIVLITFKPNTNYNNLVVNHIDGNIKNNNLQNLEWCTQKENIYHSKKISKNGSVISQKKILSLYKNCNLHENSLPKFIDLLLLNCN